MNLNGLWAVLPSYHESNRIIDTFIYLLLFQFVAKHNDINDLCKNEDKMNIIKKVKTKLREENEEARRMK